MERYRIRLARHDDLLVLPAIELEAATRFPPGTFPAGMADKVLSIEIHDRARISGQLWVAADANDLPVGFALASIIERMAFLAELDVLPTHGRQGLGTALVKCVARWAKMMDLQAVTLITFAHLPWNAPMYERLGFMRYHADELPAELARVLAEEAAQGLQYRVAMYRNCRSMLTVSSG
jgi:GNAT superfamily N-acetyltransferase